MTKIDVEIIKVENLTPDRKNANRHTERGYRMVSRSLEKLGAGRSILLDRDYEIIAGNLTTQQAVDMGIEEVIVVPTDGRQLVAVKRTDMDLDDPETGARQMAYADNRAAQTSIDFEPLQIQADIEAGEDLGEWFNEWELERFTTPAAQVDFEEEWAGMPEFDNPAQAVQGIFVYFRNEEDRESFASLIGQSITPKTKTIWHPMKERRDLKDVGWVEDVES